MFNLRKQYRFKVKTFDPGQRPRILYGYTAPCFNGKQQLIEYFNIGQTEYRKIFNIKEITDAPFKDDAGCRILYSWTIDGKEM